MKTVLIIVRTINGPQTDVWNEITTVQVRGILSNNTTGIQKVWSPGIQVIWQLTSRT